MGFHGFSQFQISSGSVFMAPGQFLWLLVVPGWFKVGFYGYSCLQVVFFMVPGLFSWLFMVPGWFFMVPGPFSCFFMVPDLSFMVPGRFLGLFMVSGWSFMFFYGSRLQVINGSRSVFQVSLYL